MARINIEECWWSDPRRSKLIRLVGDEERADGAAIKMWRTAQEFWKRNHELVPRSVFEALQCASELIQSGLAEDQGESIYVRGSSQYLEWVKNASEAGRLGGLKSAQARKEKYGSSQPKLRSEPEATSKQPEAFEPSVSGSVSDSDSNTKNYSVGELAKAAPSLPALSNAEKKLEAKAETAAKAKEFVASYVSSYQSKFPGGRPEDLNDGKVRGQILNWIKDYPLDRAIELIQVYFQMDSKWFGTKGYDFLTFRNNLNKVGQALDSGKDPDGNTLDWERLRKRAGA